MHYILFAILLSFAYAADRRVCGPVTTNDSVSPKANCGAEGRVSKKPFSSSVATDFNSCRDSCLVDDECKKFAFNFDTNACSVYHASRLRFKFKGGSGNYFWGPECFVFSGSYPIQAVTNGDFSNDNLDGWIIDSPQVVSVQSRIIPNGGPNYYMQISVYEPPANPPANSTVLQGAFTSVSLCGQVQYQLQFDFFQVPGGTVAYTFTVPPIAEVALIEPGQNDIFSQAYMVRNNSMNVSIGGKPTNIPAGTIVHYASSTFSVANTGEYNLAIVITVKQQNAKGTMGYDNITLTALN